ncbi:MAG: hypothetical protein ABI024_00400 [Vicinamibacterales bacterium]
MSYVPISRRCLAVAAALLLAGCSQTPGPTQASSRLPLGPDAVQARSSARCMNVSFDGAAALAVIEVAPGVFTLGALPAPFTLGDIPGMFGSVVTSLDTSGSKGQGAQHLTLQHSFVSSDPLRPGSFLTAARAVCAPAGTDPNVCRVSDVMQIASGTGIFANPDGVMHNHGVIDLNNFTITIALNGRVCGDGL